MEVDYPEAPTEDAEQFCSRHEPLFERARAREREREDIHETSRLTHFVAPGHLPSYLVINNLRRMGQFPKLSQLYGPRKLMDFGWLLPWRSTEISQKLAEKTSNVHLNLCKRNYKDGIDGTQPVKLLNLQERFLIH